MTPQQFLQHRKDLGLTQRELADRLGLSPKNGGNYIRMVENGKKEPSDVLIMCFEYMIINKELIKLFIMKIFKFEFLQKKYVPRILTPKELGEVSKEYDIYTLRFIVTKACERLSKLTNKPSRTIQEELEKEFGEMIREK